MTLGVNIETPVWAAVIDYVIHTVPCIGQGWHISQHSEGKHCSNYDTHISSLLLCTIYYFIKFSQLYNNVCFSHIWGEMGTDSCIEWSRVHVSMDDQGNQRITTLAVKMWGFKEHWPASCIRVPYKLQEECQWWPGKLHPQIMFTVSRVLWILKREFQV